MEGSCFLPTAFVSVNVFTNYFSNSHLETLSKQGECCTNWLHKAIFLLTVLKEHSISTAPLVCTPLFSPVAMASSFMTRVLRESPNPELFRACNLEIVTMVGEFDFLSCYLLWSIYFRMILLNLLTCICLHVNIFLYLMR